VVEVAHNVLESATLLADQVLNGDLDVFEGNISGTRAPKTADVHFTSGNARHALLQQQERNALHARTTSTDSNSEEIGVDT
jgi:hypothetical protein